MLRHENSKADAYFEWFDGSISFLWAFVHFFSNSNAEYTDEVLYILHLSRPKIAAILRESGSHEVATAEFLRMWFAKLRKPRAHPSTRSLELGWEDQFLLFTLLKSRMSVSKVSQFLRRNEATVRYDLFSVLVRQARVEELSIRCGSRDCIRFDLYFTDLFFDQSWKDPLALVDRQALEDHARKCGRCYPMSEKLRIEADRIKARAVYPVAEGFRAHVHNEIGTRWKRLVSGEWLGSVPLWVKVPLQITLVIVCIALVLNSAKITLSPSTPDGSWSQRLVSVQESLKARFLSLVDGRASKKTIDGVNSPTTALSALPTPPVPTLRQGEVSKTIAPSESLSIILRDKNFNVKVDKIPVAKPQPPAPAPVAVVVAPPAPVVAAAKAPPQVPMAAPEVKSAPIVKDQPPVVAGATSKLFYRWGAYSDDPVADAAKINELLLKFQATRSGDLHFGADYLGGKYFHFSVPKSAFAELLSQMKELDLVAFSSGQAISDKETPVELSRIVFLLLPSASRNAEAGGEVDAADSANPQGAAKSTSPTKPVSPATPASPGSH